MKNSPIGLGREKETVTGGFGLSIDPALCAISATPKNKAGNAPTAGAWRLKWEDTKKEIQE